MIFAMPNGKRSIQGIEGQIYYGPSRWGFAVASFRLRIAWLGYERISQTARSREIRTPWWTMIEATDERHIDTCQRKAAERSGLRFHGAY